MCMLTLFKSFLWCIHGQIDYRELTMFQQKNKEFILLEGCESPSIPYMEKLPKEGGELTSILFRKKRCMKKQGYIYGCPTNVVVSRPVQK